MRIIGLLHHSFCHLIIQTKVEDGVHHTGHRSTSTRTNADEQWILLVTELGVHQYFDVLYCCHHVIVKKFHDFLLAHFIILVAAIGCDGEAWRNRNTNKIHFSQVGTFTTQLFAHLRISFSFAVTEGVNSFLAHVYF